MTPSVVDKSALFAYEQLYVLCLLQIKWQQLQEMAEIQAENDRLAGENSSLKSLVCTRDQESTQLQAPEPCRQVGSLLGLLWTWTVRTSAHPISSKWCCMLDEQKLTCILHMPDLLCSRSFVMREAYVNDLSLL